MEILISNYEVLQALRGYAAHRSSSHTNEDASKVQLETSVRSYLNSTRIKTVTRPQIEGLVRRLEEFKAGSGGKLTQLEILQILNLLPNSEVELFRIVGKIEERLTEAEIQTLLELVKRETEDKHSN